MPCCGVPTPAKWLFNRLVATGSAAFRPMNEFSAFSPPTIRCKSVV